MAFGIVSGSGNQISRTKTYSGDTTFMFNNKGKKVDGTVHGAQKEVSEEFYVTDSAAFSNQVVEGAHGTNLVNGCTLNEANQDYAKFTVTRVVLPDDASYSN